jgi:nitrogen-specific signal transduction histidine kinase
MNICDVPIGVLKMDEHGHVVEANAYLARALGRSAQALKGQPFEMLLTPSSQAYYQLLLKPMRPSTCGGQTAAPCLCC